ncbi:hypothetical protein E3U43_014393 [Larimichthys crocea]|nr:hypothetical protein E3U43_001950 [Larimichthys crocea]TMS01156.1 hypothetical protein E3U43_014393 [Larimichthys crocea]
MSHRLLRRPLPPTKSLPARRASGGALIVDQADGGTRGSSRQDADTPVPRAAPPTPQLPHTSTCLMGGVTQGFPCKPPRPRPKNPLLTLLQSDSRFVAPPPVFCLSDFLQRTPSACRANHHPGSSA